jgi:anti-anti-sigma regulatory factor
MANIHCKLHDNALYMRFTGKMTVENAPKIKKSFLLLHDRMAAAYYADFSEITEIDITFLQLLMAFNKKIKTTNSQLFILGNKIGEQISNDLKTIGIDIGTHFSLSEGNNEFSGK